MHKILILLLLATTVNAQNQSYSTSIIRCPCGNAPNWAQDSRVQGFWSFNERGNSGTLIGLALDDSSFNHDLDPGGEKVLDAATVDFCFAAGDEQISCDVSCTEMCILNASYSAGCDARPDNVVTSRRDFIATDTTNGGLSSGWAIGWEQSVLGSGNFFYAHDTTGEGERTLAGSTYSHNVGWKSVIGTYTHHVPTNPGGTLELFVNTVSEGTLAMVTDLSSCGSFHIGGTSLDTVGDYDNCWVAQGVISAVDRCRIAVCQMDGCACDCNGATYLRATRHSSFGGPISCTLPNCDKATFD